MVAALPRRMVVVGMVMESAVAPAPLVSTKPVAAVKAAVMVGTGAAEVVSRLPHRARVKRVWGSRGQNQEVRGSASGDQGVSRIRRSGGQNQEIRVSESGGGRGGLNMFFGLKI